MNIFDKYVEKYLIGGEGCSEEEIKNFGDQFSLPLPKVYIDFLKVAGRQFNSYGQSYFGWVDHGNTIKNLKYYIRFAQKSLYIKDSYVFFWKEESGYMVKFFDLKDGENPPVYIYSIFQAQDHFCKISDSFTEFIELLIAEDRRLPKVITFDYVLNKEILREKNQIILYDQSNESFVDKFEIPLEVFKKIEERFDGLEREMIKKVIRDFKLEKAKFIYDKPDLFFNLLNYVNGKFSKLNHFYYEYVIRELDKDPYPVLKEFKDDVGV